MNTRKGMARWKVDVPGSKKSALVKLKVVAKTAVTAIVISAAYFGVIAVLMSPAYDVVWPA